MLPLKPKGAAAASARVAASSSDADVDASLLANANASTATAAATTTAATTTTEGADVGRRGYAQVAVRDELDGDGDGDDVEAQQAKGRARQRVAAGVYAPETQETAVVMGVPASAHPLSTSGPATAAVVAEAVPADAPTSTTTSTNAANSNTIIVNVKVVEDRTFRIPFRRDGTLQQFRVLVEAATGVPCANQRLISNGRLLANETEPLNLANESYVHLAPSSRERVSAAPATASPATTSSNPFWASLGSSLGASGPTTNATATTTSSTSTTQPDDGEPESIVEARLAAMRPGAWVTLIWFALLFWASLTMLFSGGPSPNSPTNGGGGGGGGTNPPTKEPKSEGTAFILLDLFIGLFGMFVGNLGLRATSTHNAADPSAPLDRAAVSARLWLYRQALWLLMTIYVTRIVTADPNVGDGTVVVVSLYVIMVFMMCIVQAGRAQTSLGTVPSSGRGGWQFRWSSPPRVEPIVPVVAPVTTAVPVTVATVTATPVATASTRMSSSNALPPHDAGPGVFLVGAVAPPTSSLSSSSSSSTVVRV